MFKTLSCVVTDAARDSSPLAAAAAIALREDAHLNVFCLGIEPVPLDAVSIDGPPITMEWGLAEAEERAEALTSWARTTLPIEVRASAEPSTVPALALAPTVARLTRFSDLILSARPYGNGVGALAGILCEGLLFETANPLLILPDQDQTDWTQPFDRICLAWNDSDEALRAAHRMLPWLKAAGAVDIVTVDPLEHGAGQADPGEELALWLARHGVHPEVALLPRTEPSVADHLTHFCKERGCQALIMGAFGHSRLREALLGGTTRGMLTSVPLPLIMMH